MAWTNRFHPQTLQIAVILCYVQAFNLTFGQGVIYGNLFEELFVFGRLSAWAPLAMVAAFVLGGRGIANERKWGFTLAAIAAVTTAVASVWWMLDNPGFWVLLSLAFDGALVVLLFHPEGRHYRKVWFK